MIEEIIKRFGMKLLPDEGGYYCETYRCPQKIPKDCLPKGYNGERNLSTAILYLITPDHFSRLHRISSDEIFHFYMGDPVYMLNLFEDGPAEELVLGRDILKGEKVQHLVPGGTWQGACLKGDGRFALLGTTVSPGFDFADYQSGEGSEEMLFKKYPAYKESIGKLKRKF